MTGMDLLEALSYVDERYVAEAETAKLGRTASWMKWVSLAACLCILVSAVFAYRQLGDGGAKENMAADMAAPAAPEAAPEAMPEMDAVMEDTLVEAPMEEEATAVGEQAAGEFDGDHIHSPAQEPVVREDPVTGFCGNTQVTIGLHGAVCTISGTDAVTLTDILVNLAYDPDAVCRCPAAITVQTEAGSYEVNLGEAFARCDAGQAPLTEEQVEIIEEIISDL